MPPGDTSLTIINNSINALNQTMAQIYSLLLNFPRTTASSSAAPGSVGSITFTSSEANGFLILQTSSGASVKVPYYSNP